MSAQSRIPDPKSLQGTYTCFTVGGEAYALPTQSVLGVQAVPTVRRVPKAPQFIKGVANVDGRIITIIDTRYRFEAVPSEAATGTLLVAELEGISFGVLAEQVTGITRFSREMIAPANPVLVSRETPFVTAMAMVDERLVHLVDLAALVYAGVNISKKDESAYAGYSQKALKSNRPTSRSDRQRHLIMQIGHETYGLSIDMLKAVKTSADLETFSGGPKYLSGVIKTANTIIPVVDLQKKYNLEPVRFNAQSRVVVVDAATENFGIRTTAASEMVDIASESLKDLPEAVSGESTKHIRCIAILGHNRRLVAILNPDEILTETDCQALSKVAGVDIHRRRKKSKTTGEKTMQTFLTFQVAGHELACDMGNLIEVTPYQTISRVPKAPAHIRGLIHTKGELVPVTDLKKILKIDDHGKTDEKHIIIVRKGNTLHGIIADRIGEILHVDEKNLVIPEKILHGVKLAGIEKAIRIQNSDRVPLVLNLEKTIS